MIRYEDECVGCPPHMGCIGNSCQYMHVPHYFCDVCECETDPDNLYDVNGDMVCSDCLPDVFPKISV